MNWLTADLHLAHVNIIAYCDRPYASVSEMDNDLVQRWNEIVAPDDEVWVLGDVALGRLDDSLTYVTYLNGVKHLVPGNHDRMFKCHGVKWLHGAERYIAAGFADVLDDVIELDIGGNRAVTACHFPFAGEARDGWEDRFVDHRPVDCRQRLVHGHTHGKWRRNGRMIDVGVDAWGGYPVSFETAAALFAADEEQVAAAPWVHESQNRIINGTLLALL
jgi:calcineurin-like phosphoesterase family protein